MIVFAAACGACGGTENASSTEADESGCRSRRKKPRHPGKAVPVYREVTLPAGTTLRLDLASSIASDSSKVERPFRAGAPSARHRGPDRGPGGRGACRRGDRRCRLGPVKGRARIAYRFNSLTVGEELRHRDGADVSPCAGHQRGRHEDRHRRGRGAAIGAILGGGSGAAKGAAIGGAAGTGAVLATKGQEVRLGPAPM